MAGKSIAYRACEFRFFPLGCGDCLVRHNVYRPVEDHRKLNDQEASR